MTEFEKYKLDNGLTVLLHRDDSTPMVAVNTLYDVGARDESEDKTGFAHLFEHLMFGGSVNIPEFDTPLQLAGGENNAFTSNDITNYYDTLPGENLETALWLESDRMLSLAFTEKSLEVQRSVVIEEFKQRYINQPYGNIWHLLREEAYQVHPYKWPTIGKEISHIEDATMDDVKSFFFKHYTPQNAILCVAGNLDYDATMKSIEHWYSGIDSRDKYVRSLPQEPPQNEYRLIEHHADVPSNAIYLAFKMCGRFEPNYPVYDLMSDILSRGKSSRLEENLIYKKQLFTEISAYVSGAYDQGLFVVTGKMKDDVSFELAERSIWEVLQTLIDNKVSDSELLKVKNKFESAKLFSNTNVLNRAMNLCFFELDSEAKNANFELANYTAITPQKMQEEAIKTFKKTNCNQLNYISKQKD